MALAVLLYLPCALKIRHMDRSRTDIIIWFEWSSIILYAFVVATIYF